ncbi:hypothetical protein EDB86DRAFT_2824412 [Lactarius hatsudake]|nr:hypothetical protein EDB86DRAFT_2824412 [Lactarius hatsudake]
MVNIYLNIDKSTLLFLSISDSDVQRLSIYPFKWLRRGCLSAIPGGPAIDYDSATLNDIADLYYKPLGNCVFVEYQSLDDQATSTFLTDCSNDFRDKIIARGGSACVVTRHPGEYCDAAHLYIQRVVKDRSSNYLPESLPLISGIDDVQNGVLLAKSVHSMLAQGVVAFLRTPNYGLDPTDIPRVDLGQARTAHFTLQQLKVSEDYSPATAAALEAMANTLPVPAFTLFAVGSNLDALFQGTSNKNGTSEQGTGNSLPPHIILDYMYGVAAYKQWGRQSKTTPEEFAKRWGKRMEGEEQAALETAEAK